MIKRGLAAPLLFLALALAAKGSVDASAAIWGASLLLLLAAALLIPVEARWPITALGIAVFALAAWMVATNLFAHRYSSAAQYQAAFLLGGYLYGRRIAPVSEIVLAAVLAFGVGLAGWGIAQLSVEARAHGPFITPATFAATINLVLLPALVFAAVGPRRPAFWVLLGVLILALAATTSRGGWLALATAAALSMLFLRRGRLPINRGTVALLGGVLILGFAGVWLWNHASIGSTTLRELATGSEAASASAQSRFELYRLVLMAMQPSTVSLGGGYDAFYYLVESGRSFVPTYATSTTYFVHNDYLQMLYAFGIPGIAALLFLAVAPFAAAWRKLPQLAERDRVIALAALAALASMALHALVDFPFFVPVCALLYGGALGILDATLLRGSANPQVTAPPPPWRRGLKAAVVTLAAWILAVPVAAEAAAGYAEAQWRQANAERAAWWFEAARRIDARDWRYHWYAAQFWAAHAVAHADAAAARQADVALAAAIAANDRDVRPLHRRIELHTRLRNLLAQPADGETLRAWADRAVALAPADPVVRTERERVFRQFPPR